MLTPLEIVIVQELQPEGAGDWLEGELAEVERFLSTNFEPSMPAGEVNNLLTVFQQIYAGEFGVKLDDLDFLMEHCIHLLPNWFKEMVYQ